MGMDLELYKMSTVNVQSVAVTRKAIPRKGFGNNPKVPRTENISEIDQTEHHEYVDTLADQLWDGFKNYNARDLVYARMGGFDTGDYIVLTREDIHSLILNCKREINEYLDDPSLEHKYILTDLGSFFIALVTILRTVDFDKDSILFCHSN